MLGLGLLSLVALAGVVGYHMVHPNVRDVRVSMTHLMPDPPASQAPKRKFSLGSLIRSIRFWLRLLCVGLVSLALYPLMLPPVGTQNQSRHYRLIVDVSASMGVNDAGRTRMDLAREVGTTALEAIASQKPEREAAYCMDLVTVGASAKIYPEDQAAQVLATAQPQPEGSAMATLLGALAIGGGGECTGTPTHAVVVTDLPEQNLTQDRFAGHVIWHQVGAPQDNRAIANIALRTGSLRNTDPRIALRVTAYGVAPRRLTAIIEGPAGHTEVVLLRDEARADGWSADVPFGGAGRYRVLLPDGGALAIDDQVTFDLGELGRVAVDWRLSQVPRPGILAPPRDDATIIVVDLYQGPDAPLPDGPFVMVYDGWPNGNSTRIGPFMRDHPILEGVNFDVLEQGSPRALTLGDAQPLNVVIRPDVGIGVWVAVRDEPRGALVPMPFDRGDGDTDALSRLMFYNALSWVAEAATPDAPILTYQMSDGQRVPNATAESDVARPLSDPPHLSLLGEPPLVDVPAGVDPRGQSEKNPWMPWLFALSVLIMLAERVVGLIWIPKRVRDV